MKRLFRSFGVYFRAFPGVLLFELMFKLILSALGIPLIALVVKLSMNNAGITYLSGGNLKALLTSPFTWIAIPILLFIMAFFSIIELSALTACYACRFDGKKLTASEMLRSGLRGFSKAVRGAGVLRFIGFMLSVLAAQLTMTAGAFFTPLMPVLRSVAGNLGQLLYIAVLIAIEVLVTMVLVSRSYSLHYLILTENNFSECIRKSRSILDKKKLITAAEILLCILLLVVITAVIAFGLSFAVIFCIKGFTKPTAAMLSSLKLLSYIGQLLSAISAIIAAPTIICFLTSSFLRDNADTERLILPDYSDKKLSKPIRVTMIVLTAAVSVFLNFSYIQQLYKGNLSVNLGIFTMPRLTAHRGFSHIAPENTAYAFEEAINIGSDCIELDVQQSADGQLVVIHDDTLNRTTDGKGKVADHTYEELSALSCGKWFKKGDFADAEIMLLSEVLEMAEDEILLNIEIKKAGNEMETAEKAVALIQEYDMVDSCYITSFSYHALKAAKNVEPKIKTGLIANIATAAVYSQMKYADAISINYLFANKNVVSEAHRNGKLVFVWTVNRRSDMERMISIGVDNIITDRPDIAAEAVYSYGKGDLIISFLENIFGTVSVRTAARFPFKVSFIS